VPRPPSLTTEDIRQRFSSAAELVELIDSTDVPAGQYLMAWLAVGRESALRPHQVELLSFSDLQPDGTFRTRTLRNTLTGRLSTETLGLVASLYRSGSERIFDLLDTRILVRMLDDLRQPLGPSNLGMPSSLLSKPPGRSSGR
jgi:hypothetical protein